MDNCSAFHISISAAGYTRGEVVVMCWWRETGELEEAELHLISPGGSRGRIAWVQDIKWYGTFFSHIMETQINLYKGYRLLGGISAKATFMKGLIYYMIFCVMIFIGSKKLLRLWHFLKYCFRGLNHTSGHYLTCVASWCLKLIHDLCKLKCISFSHRSDLKEEITTLARRACLVQTERAKLTKLAVELWSSLKKDGELELNDLAWVKSDSSSKWDLLDSRWEKTWLDLDLGFGT